jgi:hypothetical protein
MLTAGRTERRITMIEERSFRSQLTYETEPPGPAGAGPASRLYRVQCYKFAHLTSLMSLINGSAAGDREQEALDAFIRHWDDDVLDGDALMRILEVTLDLCLDYLRQAAMVSRAAPVALRDAVADLDQADRAPVNRAGG